LGSLGYRRYALAKNFDRDLKEKVKEISAAGKEWSVCGDLSELYPQSKEVCRIIGDGIAFAVKHGMSRGIHLENSMS
jgi:hypothetical protein